MAARDRWFDWHGAVVRNAAPPVAADPQRRIRVLGLLTAVCFAAVFARCLVLEFSEGDAFRAVALKVSSAEAHKRAPRGRILARDGTPLALDAVQLSLALDYRYLQRTPQASWLRRLARAQRGVAATPPTESLSATVNRLRVQHADMHRRLAALCGVSHEEWLARCGRIEDRVQGMAAHVNRRRRESYAAQQAQELAAASDEASSSADTSWPALITTSLKQLFAPPQGLPPARITIREEVDKHVLAVGISQAAAAEIEHNPQLYPGVRIERKSVRTYPRGSTASHLIGYLGKPREGELPAEHSANGAAITARRVGRAGVEQAWEESLRGVIGIDIEKRDAGGQLLSTQAARQAVDGADVRLTIDLALQTTAEQLLDRVQQGRKAPLVRSKSTPDVPNHGGGSVVVMDIESGELLALASAPRFEPSLFVRSQAVSFESSDQIRELLSDPYRSLFHRATQMALPPGSAFKPLSAVAMLERGVTDGEAPFVCRGYLQQPDAQRCYIFRRYGVGHGPLTIVEALATSCNVYFFHHADALGPQPLVMWASRFGFGQPTGLDLPGEVRGNLSSPRSLQEKQGRAWQLADTQALTIGQGTLTATPLQMVRMIAAVASGGRLVTPRIVLANEGESSAAVSQIPLQKETLRLVREGMRQAVANEDGTAHRAFAGVAVEVAGKTGTAEAGTGQKDHAWFVGYAPADKPQVAFAVALEHAGGGGAIAAPVARHLVDEMIRLGYFDAARLAERRDD